MMVGKENENDHLEGEVVVVVFQEKEEVEVIEGDIRDVVSGMVVDLRIRTSMSSFWTLNRTKEVRQ